MKGFGSIEITLSFFREFELQLPAVVRNTDMFEGQTERGTLALLKGFKSDPLEKIKCQK